MARLRTPSIPFFLLALLIAAPLPAQDKRAMTFTDVMKFKRIYSPVLADSGTAVAYEARPDRGDGELFVHDLVRNRVHRVARGSGAKFTADGAWLAAVVTAPAFGEGSKDKPGMALLELATGKVVQRAEVKGFAFSKDGKFLVWSCHVPVKKGGEAETPAAPSDESKRTKGTKLGVQQLGSDRVIERDWVTDFAFDPESRRLTYSVAEPAGLANGLYQRDLADADLRERPVLTRPEHLVTAFAWDEAGAHLAAMQAPEDADGRDGAGAVFVIADDERWLAAHGEALGADWALPSRTSLRWSKDGARLFFGFQSREMFDLLAEREKKKNGAQDTEEDPFDLDHVLEDRGVDVWHWNDPQISPNQKKAWGRFSRRTYDAVYHVAERRLVQLCDEAMPSLQTVPGSLVALGRSDVPYRKETTWDGRYSDVYLVDLASGERARILERHSGPVSLSPKGTQVVFWRDGDWHYLGRERPEAVVNLTEGVGRFANEDHDYPSDVPGYGVAGWLEDESAVLVYDKFDVWSLAVPDVRHPLAARAVECITAGEGRKARRTFRVLRTDPEKTHIASGETLLLSSYRDLRKSWGFYQMRLGKPGVARLLEDDKKFSFLAKAKDDDRILYTRESYTEFPDLWVATADLRQRQKVSDLGGQTDDYAWGDAELVEWRSVDGTPLQGVLIKPGNYVEGQRYPVLVYYYRFYSQRLNEFNAVVVNHRPCFPFYASNGYAVFLPDIRFDVGHPGYAATKCLVPGVQKLIDMGVADPDAIALHGHSWSGYQTAFVITQTNAFRCAIAGAPVSNMTSAYGGIRWGTGVSRQFQYEKTQSRIGGSLWEYPERYIENSPVFFADRIETPLLIQFGDEDGAVPWYQGIELYMAMRRLGKDCVFLQYRGEPHHLQKYANKLDYSIKFKEYLDHYCKGEPAPQWLKQGVPYRGR